MNSGLRWYTVARKKLTEIHENLITRRDGLLKILQIKTNLQRQTDHELGPLTARRMLLPKPWESSSLKKFLKFSGIFFFKAPSSLRKYLFLFWVCCVILVESALASPKRSVTFYHPGRQTTPQERRYTHNCHFYVTIQILIAIGQMNPLEFYRT